MDSVKVGQVKKSLISTNSAYVDKRRRPFTAVYMI